MAKNYKRYPMRFRERAVERMKLGRARVRGKERDERDLRIEELEGKLARIEGVVGRQWLELDFFESALRKIEGMRRKNGSSGEPACMPRSAAGCDRKAD